MSDDIKMYSVEEINDFFRTKDQLAKHFDITVEEANETSAVTSMPLEEKHMNGIGTAHGGATFSLADIAFGAASAGAGLYCVSTQTSFSYLNVGRVGPIRAKAILVKGGSKLRVYSVQVHDGNGLLMAQGMITGYKIGYLQDLV